MRIHALITDTESLEKLCERLARCDFVAIDTVQDVVSELRR